ncbi:hypothetical protein ACSBR1_011201 [Camellia fascicularis]
MGWKNMSKNGVQIDEAYKKGRWWTINQSNNDVYEVHSHPSVLVDIGKHTCSCFQWQINGLPCKHAMVAIWNSGTDLNVLVDPYFHVVNYRTSHSHTIYQSRRLRNQKSAQINMSYSLPLFGDHLRGQRRRGYRLKGRMFNKFDVGDAVGCGIIIGQRARNQFSVTL